MSTAKKTNADLEYEVNNLRIRLDAAERRNEELTDERDAAKRLLERTTPLGGHRAYLQDLHRELGRLFDRRDPEVRAIVFAIEYTDGKIYPHCVHLDYNSVNWGGLRSALDTLLTAGHTVKWNTWAGRKSRAELETGF